MTLRPDNYQKVYSINELIILVFKFCMLRNFSLDIWSLYIEKKVQGQKSKWSINIF